MVVQNILVIIGSETQYDVLRIFARELVEGFEKINKRVEVLDLAIQQEMSYNQQCIKYDLMVSFNGIFNKVCIDDKLMEKNILKWDIYVDPPLYHHVRMMDSRRNQISSFIDREQVAFAKTYYKNVNEVVFLPHGGSEPSRFIPFDKRKYNIVFFGTYKNPDIFLPKFAALSENLQDILFQCVERIYNEPSFSYFEIIEEEFLKANIVFSEDQFRALLRAISFVYDYTRNLKRKEVIKSFLVEGISVEVFGNGWESFEGENKELLNVHDAVSYTESIDIMANSKIVLNVMPLFTNGSHERIFTTMLCKSICLSDESLYLKELCKEEDYITFYQFPELNNTLPSLVENLLSNNRDIERKLDRAYHYAKDHHTWFHRAASIVEYVENYQNPYEISVCENNIIDREFNEFKVFINNTSEETLREKMKANVCAIANIYAQEVADVQKSFERYKYWGTFNVDDNKFDVVIDRVRQLKDHFNEICWLYDKLEDYYSKAILKNVMLNWETFDFRYLKYCQAFGEQQHYFDNDIIQLTEEEVFIDLGASIGDTTMNFIKQCGNRFRKIVCYECDKENVNALKGAFGNDSRIVIRDKAVGEKHGYASFTEGEDSTAGNVDLVAGIGENMVEVVSLDDEIQEKVTFIKSDIEGAERYALWGAKGHIKEEHPKLAISIYHGNEDIWKIAKVIEEIDDTYKFYMRYYGGDEYPSEIVLYAI